MLNFISNGDRFNIYKWNNTKNQCLNDQVESDRVESDPNCCYSPPEGKISLLRRVPILWPIFTFTSRKNGTSLTVYLESREYPFLSSFLHFHLVEPAALVCNLYWEVFFCFCLIFLSLDLSAFTDDEVWVYFFIGVNFVSPPLWPYPTRGLVNGMQSIWRLIKCCFIVFITARRTRVGRSGFGWVDSTENRSI